MNFSIIIPTYNRSILLIDALSSFARQDYSKKQFEIIVVDNNSIDQTEQCVKRFIEKNRSKLNIKYILEKRKGATFARHTGAMNAEGAILCFADDDGIYEENWISKILEVYYRHPETVAAGTRILIQWDKKPPDWILQYENLLGKIDNAKGIVYGKNLYINAGSFSIKKSTLFELGGFGPDLISDYLIGDGETSLNKKISHNDYTVGLTFDTTMWHHQFVDKNATIKDISRRFKNDGIANAYRDLIVNREFFIIVKNLCLLFVKGFNFWFSVYFLKKHKMHIFFQTQYLASYITYFLRYRTDISFRKAMLKKDWVLNNNYSSPKPKYTGNFKE